MNNHHITTNRIRRLSFAILELPASKAGEDWGASRYRRPRAPAVCFLSSGASTSAMISRNACSITVQGGRIVHIQVYSRACGGIHPSAISTPNPLPFARSPPMSMSLLGFG